MKLDLPFWGRISKKMPVISLEKKVLKAWKLHTKLATDTHGTFWYQEMHGEGKNDAPLVWMKTESFLDTEMSFPFEYWCILPVMGKLLWKDDGKWQKASNVRARMTMIGLRMSGVKREWGFVWMKSTEPVMNK